jgi:hypothetical protein
VHLFSGWAHCYCGHKMYVKSLYERWQKLPVSDKRKIVEALIEKITIGDGEIDIMFSHLPSSEELCKNQQKLIPKCR